MNKKIIWTSNVTETQAKKAWEETKERCPWADLGSFETNKEIAMDKERNRNHERLLAFCEEFASTHVSKGDMIEIFKEGYENPIFTFSAGGFLVPDLYETLFACIERVSVYERGATLRVENNRLWIDVDWEDWLTKEKGIYHYTIKINGKPAQL